MEKRLPIRQCAACRTHRAKHEFLRVVRTADGAVSLDRKGNLPGRGVYLCPDAACLKRAVKTRAVERALGVPIPPEVAAALAERMAGDGGG